MAMVQRFRTTKLVTLSLLTATFLATAHDVNAQPFPSRVITIVVPTAPATPPDIISRVVATELSESEGWNIVVENKAGAVLTLGGSEVLKHPADGHAIYAMALPVSAAPALLPNMPFKLESDFAPVIKISTSYNVLVVNPSVPAKSVSDLVALVKEKPDKLTFSSGGFGTPLISSEKCSSCRLEPVRRTCRTTSFRRRSVICSTAPTTSCSSRHCLSST